MKKKKCVDCGLYFKDRERDGDADHMHHPDSCFNCAFVRQCMELSALAAGNQVNRKVEITLKISKTN